MLISSVAVLGSESILNIGLFASERGACERLTLTDPSERREQRVSPFISLRSSRLRIGKINYEKYTHGYVHPPYRWRFELVARRTL